MLLETLLWHWPDTAIKIGITIVVALACRWLVSVSIHRVVRASQLRAHARDQLLATRAGRLLDRAGALGQVRQLERAKTLGGLLSSIGNVIIFVIATLTIFSAVNLPLGPVLASAGIGGVAIGFGAQSLVKDLLSGIFMVAEDQFGVGDRITVGDVTGVVEEVSLRITRVRDANGTIWYLRNGEIVRLANLSQSWSVASVDIPVAYAEDPAHVISVLREALAPLEAHGLLDAPEVLGVQSIVGQTMMIRAQVRSDPGSEAGLQRLILETAKTALDAAGVHGGA